MWSILLKLEKFIAPTLMFCLFFYFLTLHKWMVHNFNGFSFATLELLQTLNIDHADFIFWKNKFHSNSNNSFMR
jgi:hypothetical protein